MTDWEEQCLEMHGRVLTGKQAHWCGDWDGLPIDETTPYYSGCTCVDFPAENVSE